MSFNNYSDTLYVQRFVPQLLLLKYKLMLQWLKQLKGLRFKCWKKVLYEQNVADVFIQKHWSAK